MSGNAPHNCPFCDKSFAWGEDADSPAVAAKGIQFVSCRTNAFWKLSFHIEGEHPEKTFLCARRGESGVGMMYDRRDYFRTHDHHSSCSYCGSMNQDEFFAAIARGDEIVPTDKSYKVYVMLPNPDVGKTIQIGSRSAPVTAVEDPTPEEIAVGRIDRPIMGVATATTQAKFYFQHLDHEGQGKFVDLVNSNGIKFGVPGYLYRAPYFAVPKKGAA